MPDILFAYLSVYFFRVFRIFSLFKFRFPAAGRLLPSLLFCFSARKALGTGCFFPEVRSGADLYGALPLRPTALAERVPPPRKNTENWKILFLRSTDVKEKPRCIGLGLAILKWHFIELILVISKVIQVGTMEVF